MDLWYVSPQPAVQFQALYGVWSEVEVLWSEKRLSRNIRVLTSSSISTQPIDLAVWTCDMNSRCIFKGILKHFLKTLFLSLTLTVSAARDLKLRRGTHELLAETCGQSRMLVQRSALIRRNASLLNPHYSIFITSIILIAHPICWNSDWTLGPYSKSWEATRTFSGSPARRNNTHQGTRVWNNLFLTRESGAPSGYISIICGYLMRGSTHGLQIWMYIYFNQPQHVTVTQ